MKGCDRPTPDFLRIVVRGMEFDRCPQYLISQTPEVAYFLRLHRFYSAGFLPFSGSLSHQPAVIMEAFEIIDQINAEKMNVSSKPSDN